MERSLRTRRPVSVFVMNMAVGDIFLIAEYVTKCVACVRQTGTALRLPRGFGPRLAASSSTQPTVNLPAALFPSRPSRRRALQQGAGLAAMAALGGCANTAGPREDARSGAGTVRTPQEFGAVGNGVADDTAAFRAAGARLGDFIRVPPGRYVIKGTIDVLSGQTWQLENAEILHAGPGPAFKATYASDWALLGPGRLAGAGRKRTATENIGLLVEGGKRYRVSRLQFSRFAQAGMVVTVVGAAFSDVVPRGDRGQMSDLGFNECATGVDVQAATGAEYNVFTNTAVTDCDVGIIASAGNTQFVGGNVTDCVTGISLNIGHNNSHGGFHAFNVNHCAQYSVHANGVTNGHTFIGCNFYSDRPAAGIIFLQDSKGILFQGCQIDCAVIADGKFGSNYLLNNTVAGANFRIGSNKGDQDRIVCRNNFRFDGTDACVP